MYLISQIIDSQGKNFDEVEYYRLRGKCYVKLEDWDKAISDFRRTLIINPTDEDDRFSLACIMFDGRKYRQALEGKIILSSKLIYNFDIASWPDANKRLNYVR